MNVPSPCLRNFKVPNHCTLDNENYCIVCRRNKKEITDWFKKTDEEKIIVWRNILKRGYEPHENIDISFIE
jgi:predicted Fe-S protein YdhL (DUF1289 family)